MFIKQNKKISKYLQMKTKITMPKQPQCLDWSHLLLCYVIVHDESAMKRII